jgi:hypothetical protein
MRCQQPRRGRASVILLFASLCVSVFSSTPAFASYRAWYAQWDNIGSFEAGDISEDYFKLTPPQPGICGLRIKSPNTYAWVNDDMVPVAAGNLSKDIIMWLDNPGCSRPFSVRYADDSQTFLPAGGAVSIELFNSEGAYWVTDTGYYYFICDNCVAVDNKVVYPPEDFWSLPAASAFKSVSASMIDPLHQSAVVGATGSLAFQLSALEPAVAKRIVNRRRASLGGLETSVRSLEDAGMQALASASDSAERCQTFAQQGAYTKAFVECTTAGRQVEQSGSLLAAAWSLYSQPVKK